MLSVWSVSLVLVDSPVEAASLSEVVLSLLLPSPSCPRRCEGRRGCDAERGCTRNLGRTTGAPSSPVDSSEESSEGGEARAGALFLCGTAAGLGTVSAGSSGAGAGAEAGVCDLVRCCTDAVAVEGGLGRGAGVLSAFGGASLASGSEWG